MGWSDCVYCVYTVARSLIQLQHCRLAINTVISCSQPVAMGPSWVLVILFLCGSLAADVSPPPGFCLFKEPYQTQEPVDMVNTTVIRWRDLYKCCRGFLPADNKTCVPNCPGGCGGGNCTAPYTCSCSKGYTLHEISRKCVSQCYDGCPNGACLGLNICQCHEGFKKNPLINKCEATCDLQCINADCTGHNTCTCHVGYSKFSTSSYTCEPSCSGGCKNGDCVAPNVCKCHEGYVQDLKDNRTCTPSCKLPCANGKCTAKDTCTCDPGYSLGSKNTHICLPVCSNGCINGVCSPNNVCTCYLGYYKNASGVCVPECVPPCVNADCTAPDTCSCYVGYAKYEANVYMCHASCIGCTNGECTAPNVCNCYQGFSKAENGSGLCVHSKLQEPRSSSVMWTVVAVCTVIALTLLAAGTWYWRRRRVSPECNHFYNPVYMSEQMVVAISQAADETTEGEVNILNHKK